MMAMTTPVMAAAAATPPHAPSAATSTFDRSAALEVINTRPGGEKLLDLTFLQAIPAPKRKRVLSLEVGDDGNAEDAEDATSGDGGSDSTETPQTSKAAQLQHPRKQRKPTHVLRKEAKEKLLEELRHLEARAALLRQETGQADPRELQQRIGLSVGLREAILQRDLVIANSQSALSSYVSSRVGSPIETYIHLTKDWTQRRATLLAMKDAKLRDANRFLVERTRHLNPFKASSEVSQFETDAGDVCMVKVDVTPFEGVTSVRQVFDALQFYYTNLEISLSDMSGNVTIRENDDYDADQAVLHHRLVTAERSGVLVEKNAVIFIDHSDFAAPCVEDQWAISVGDFVDQDDLYPYCSSQRLRKDSTSVAKLTAHRRPRRSATAVAPLGMFAAERMDSSGDDDDELVVVLTRWHLMRMHRPAFELRKDAFTAIASEQSDALNVMLRSMRQGIFTAPAPAPAPAPAAGASWL